MGKKEDIIALQQQLTAKEAEVTSLLAEVNSLKSSEVNKELDTLRSECRKNYSAIALKDDEIKKLKWLLENPPPMEDCVFLKGGKFKIVFSRTAKEFALSDFRKRFCDEDQTVVLLDRHGD